MYWVPTTTDGKMAGVHYYWMKWSSHGKVITYKWSCASSNPITNSHVNKIAWPHHYNLHQRHIVTRMVTFLSKRNVTFLWWRLFTHHFSATPTYMLCFAITKLANGATRHYDFSRILLAVYSLLDHGYVDTRGKPLTIVNDEQPTTLSVQWCVVYFLHVQQACC